MDENDIDLEVARFFTRSSYSRESFEEEGLDAIEQISITAKSGAGKTTATRELGKKLGWMTLSGGWFMRNQQKELGFETIEKFDEYNLAHPELDFDGQCDRHLRKRVLEYKFGRLPLIIESRLSHCLSPEAYHVFLKCNLDIRAQRRFNEDCRKNPSLTLEEVRLSLDKRDRDNEKRLVEKYPGSYWPQNDFDLVIDSGIQSVEFIVHLITQGYISWRERTLRQRKSGAELAMV
jgi:cytidylate kinase